MAKVKLELYAVNWLDVPFHSLLALPPLIACPVSRVVSQCPCIVANKTNCLVSFWIYPILVKSSYPWFQLYPSTKGPKIKLLLFGGNNVFTVPDWASIKPSVFVGDSNIESLLVSGLNFVSQSLSLTQYPCGLIYSEAPGVPGIPAGQLPSTSGINLFAGEGGS